MARRRRRWTIIENGAHDEHRTHDTADGRPHLARLRTPRDRADAYEGYNNDVGTTPLIDKALALQTFRDDREEETAFMTISYRENVEAMGVFAGRDPTKIHHLDRDAEFLIELLKKAPILRLLTSQGATG